MKKVTEDNARKFTLTAIDADFLKKHTATSFLLITDWLEMNDDNEKKVVSKEFKDDTIELLLIQKFTIDGKRTVPPKEKLSMDDYEKYLTLSKRQAQKMRHEFEYVQNGTRFSMKYDEFIGSELRILEVDASTEKERDSFSAQNFPYTLHEVSGDTSYNGYKVTEHL